MSAAFTAFQDGAVLLETGHWVEPRELPVECWIRWFPSNYPEPEWYRIKNYVTNNQACLRLEEEVPDWVRTFALIL